MKKFIQIILGSLIVLSLIYIFILRKIYTHHASQPEPIFWQGALKYRINFRDVGKSLNQCLGRKQFADNLMFRSNKNFSGWNCDKIQSPKTIYSFNFDPDTPQTYYCLNNNNQKQFGIKFNDNFVINNINILNFWDDLKFSKTMCAYFFNALNDLANQNSFLFHCEVGRDRTGDFAAMLTYILLEDMRMNTNEMINALECDYSKTSAIKKHHIGHVKSFLTNIKNNNGLKTFIQSKCQIPDSLIHQAANNFITE